jgi:hypothetical protein
VLFRKHTVLPLDDCFYALRATIKFAFAQLHPTANVKTAVNFGEPLALMSQKFGLGVPIHSVLKV